ncbi:MAG: ComEC/Rec2 family competence protein [Ruminococcus sp.]|nr:ComEC/Rec2 family competence protein [Ruminococcus sp.]
MAMKRKMALIGFPFAFGLFFSSFMSNFISALVLAAVIVVSAVLFFIIKKYRNIILIVSVAVVFAFAINILYNKLYVERILSYSGESVQFSGYIKDYEYLSSDTLRITAKGTMNSKVSTQLSFITDSVEVDYYDKINCSLTVEEIENTVSFNAKDYYNSLGIYLEGDDCENVQITPVSFSFMRYILKYRDYLFEEITSYLPDDTGGFLGAMLCGDKTEIDGATKLSLYRCGLGHIFAQSGVHLVIITGLLYSVLSIFLKNKKLVSIASLFVILLFTLFAGASPSVVRAAIMSGLIYSSYLFNRKPDPLNSLALSAVVILVISPASVRSVSFILSFTGAFAVGVLAPFLQKKFATDKNRAFLSLALPSVCASLVTTPVSLFYFSEISLISPVTNILLVPICTMALTLTALVAVTGGISIIAHPILIVASLLVKGVIKLCEAFSSIPFSYIGTGSAVTKAAVILFCVSLILCLVFSKKLSSVFKRAYCLFSLVCVLTLSSSLIFGNSVSVYDLTSGSKTVIVAVKNNYAAVFDTNGRSGLGSAVESLLEENNVKSVDLFLSKNTANKEAYYKSSLYVDISSVCDITDSSVECSSIEASVTNTDEALTLSLEDMSVIFDKENSEVIYSYK